MPRKEIAIVESGKTYLGVVEDNKDPERQCRCRIRVVNVHDGQNDNGEYEIKTENLPWAKPWKDLNGNASNVPDIGKVVVVVFEKAKTNSPEYIYSNHYNVNLEKKMAAITESDYLSMKSLLFDHKTQIYVNDTEGLKIDHKFNNVNITDKSIDINLKDNFAKLSLGTPNATQRAILGDNFMQWFDTFLDIFAQCNALLGNFGAPIVPSSTLYDHISLYQNIRNETLLSKNVYIVDNEYVKKQERIADATLGDKWESTVVDNKLTTEVPVTYNSVPGASSTQFAPQENIQPKADGTTPEATTPPVQEKVAVKEPNPDVRVVIQLMKDKNYKLYNEPMKLNVVAVRNQCLTSGDSYTDSFSDDLYVTWVTESGEWDMAKFRFSTVPGLNMTMTEEIAQKGLTVIGRSFPKVDMRYERQREEIIQKYINKKITCKFMASLLQSETYVLTPSQYLDTFQLSSRELTTKKDAKFLFYVDKNLQDPKFVPENLAKPLSREYNVVIGKGYPGGKNVGYWGMYARQCFSNERELTEFIELCKKHIEKHQNSISYTLVTKNDWTRATENAIVNKNDPGTDPKTVADPPVEKAPAVVKDKPPGKPTELLDKDDITAFQVFANRSGEKISEDGSWGGQTNTAWEKHGETYLRKIGIVKSSTLRLCFARLYPYGRVMKLEDGSLAFESQFNNNKYSITLYSNKRFVMTDRKLNQNIAKGSFTDGCRTLSTTVNGKDLSVKGPNSWDNIRKMLTQINNA